MVDLPQTPPYSFTPPRHYHVSPLLTAAQSTSTPQWSFLSHPLSSSTRAQQYQHQENVITVPNHPLSSQCAPQLSREEAPPSPSLFGSFCKLHRLSLVKLVSNFASKNRRFSTPETLHPCSPLRHLPEGICPHPQEISAQGPSVHFWKHSHEGGV